MRRKPICRRPVLDRGAEPVEVVAGGETRERREEHRRDGDGEHPLRQHVEPERGVDRRRREVGIDQPRREQRVDHGVHVDQPERQRHREHQLEEPAHRGIAPVEHELQPAVEPSQPRHRAAAAGSASRRGSRRRRRRARRSRSSTRGTPSTSPAMIARFQNTGRQRRDREVVVGVEDPDDDAAEPEQHDDREQHLGEADGEVEVAARVAERRRSGAARSG